MSVLKIQVANFCYMVTPQIPPVLETSLKSKFLSL